ncbi:MAG: cupin domain-containing protein [Kiritimatiellia bacterium]|nr:cupin domain-containing protein [Kiritimatiellia bacterium]
MYKKSSDLKRDKMFSKGREYGEAIHLADKEDLPGGVTFYAILKLKEGEEIGYHQHVGEKEFFHFLEGQGEINDNGQIVQVAPGDVVMTPADGWHAFKNTGTGDLVFTALIIRSEK